MQREVGNNRTTKLLKGIQNKLAIGSENDCYEREADEVANTVVSGQKVARISRLATDGIAAEPSQTSLRKEKEQTLQTRRSSGADVEKEKSSVPAPDEGQRRRRVVEPASTQSRINTITNIQSVAESGSSATIDNAGIEAQIASPGAGSSLPDSLRSDMESGLSADFSSVRVHDTAPDREVAESLGAKAFTHKNHIWVGPGGSPTDRKLMAHELTHVVQQDGVIHRKPELLSGDSATDGVQAPLHVNPQISAAGVTEETAGSGRSLDTVFRDSDDRMSVPGHDTEGSSEAGAKESDAVIGKQSADEISNPDIDTTGPAVAEDSADSSSDQTQAVNTDSDASYAASTGVESISVEPQDSGLALQDSEGQTEQEVLEENSPVSMSGDSMQVQSASVGDDGEPSGLAGDAETPAPLEDFGTEATSTVRLIQRRSLGERIGGFFRSMGSAVLSVGSSLAEGISSRINGLVSGVRAGWNTLSVFGSGIAGSMSRRFSGLIQGLSGMAGGLITGISRGWDSLQQQATELTQGITHRLSGALAPVLGAAKQMVSAVTRVDAQGLMSAWQAVMAGVGSVFNWVTGAVQAVGQRISRMWSGLTQRFKAFAGRLSSRARALFARVSSVANRIRGRLSSLWRGVHSRASRLSGYIGGLAGRLQSLLGGIVSRGRSLWSAIRSGWSGLKERVGGVVSSIRQRLSRIWSDLRRRITTFRNSIAESWRRLRQWVGRQLQRLVSGVRAVWNRMRRFTGRVMALVRKLASVATVYRLARQLATGLREFLSPLSDKVTDKVYAAMPGTAQAYAGEQLARFGPALAADGGQGAGVVVQRSPLLIQRQPRSTASFKDIGIGVYTAMQTMWNNLTWGVFKDMVLNVLLEQLLPIVAIYRQIRDFFVIDMYNLFTNFYWPRNLFSDPLGFLHDLWSNIYHFVVDIVMSLLRRLVNILMSFMFWITVILTIVGAVGGGVVVGILGGILGGLAGLGVGAGPGAAAGAGAGGAAGAGVGFGVAMLVNEVIFFAFLAVHALSIQTLLADLLTTRQTQREKDRDYLQLAESILAVGVGLALMFLAWLAGLIAKGAAALLRRIMQRLNIKPPSVNVPPALSRFGRGAGSAQKPRPGAPPAEAVGRALAAEQRLAGQVGGSLARQLVSKLGPDVAEALVANLGARVASRLTTEQVERLATLTAEQVLRLSQLGEAGFTRIINLPESQFNRFAVLGEAQLRAFAGMEEAAFARFTALDAHQFAKFQGLSAEALGRFAALGDAAFTRFAALDAATLNKFINMPAVALERFGGISNVAFNRFAALDVASLNKFTAVPQAALERFGGMSQAQFQIIAQAQQATLDRFATLSDASFNRFAGANYNLGQWNKLGTLETSALENLAAVSDSGRFRFLTKALNETALSRLGELTGLEIDRLVVRVGTNPPRLTNLATLDVASIRILMNVADDGLLQRFSSLAPNELMGFNGLTTAELNRFVSVAVGDLGRFGRMGNLAGLRRMAALSQDQIAVFGRLSDAQLSVWMNADATTLGHFASNDLLTLGKLADGAGVSGLNRLATLQPRFVQEISLLSPAAMQRYLALPSDQLAKFETMTAYNMEVLAGRPAGQLENLAATRSQAQLLVEAGDTAANRATNRAAVSALDDPTINPATGRPRGHASDHSVATNQVPAAGGMSPVEVRLRTGVTPSGHSGTVPQLGDEISAFASDAVQLRAVQLGEVELNAQIAAGNAIGPGNHGRHEFPMQLEGVGYNYSLQGATWDTATNQWTGGVMVRRQASEFIIVYQPKVAAPTTISDYFIVTMFPQ
jgi:phage-related protein